MTPERMRELRDLLAYANSADHTRAVIGLQRALAILDAAIAEQHPTPIPMLLWCPRCHAQHVDAPSEGWDNPPHRSHLCHACGCVWRPADVETTGVAAIGTRGSRDTWSIAEHRTADVAKPPRPCPWCDAAQTPYAAVCSRCGKPLVNDVSPGSLEFSPLHSTTEIAGTRAGWAALEAEQQAGDGVTVCRWTKTSAGYVNCKSLGHVLLRGNMPPEVCHSCGRRVEVV